MRLRSHLIALVLAVLLPMIAFSALAIVMLDRYQRENTERSAVELARALMSAVDEALRSTITTLEALATVRSLEEEDLRAFDREARRVLTTQADWLDVIVLARNVEQFLGNPISREFAALIDAPPQRWKVTRTLEGSPVYTVWARSPQSGWGVGLGIPEAAVETPLRRSLLTVGAGGLACAIVALGVALLVGRRITQPIVALASAAKAFAQHDVAVPSRTGTV